MADTITIPATGSGSATPVVATDDAGAAGHVQVVKLAIATDGSATFIPADATAGLLCDPSDDALRDNGKVDVASLDQYTPVSGRLPVDGSGVTLTVGSHAVTNAGTFAVQAAQSGTWIVQPGNTQNTTPWAVAGIIAHDGANTSANNPAVAGAEAIAHGTNPTAVAAADVTKVYANRAGIPFVIAGHPNIITLEAAYAAAAQTDTAIVTVGAGAKIVVTQIQVVADEANTVGVGFRVGFGTANTPTTTGVVLTHPGLVPGSGVSRGDGSGILGVGADNEDLRITAEAATGGSIRVLVSYYTIES